MKLKLSNLGREIYKGGNIEVLKPILEKDFKTEKELNDFFRDNGQTKEDCFNVRETLDIFKSLKVLKQRGQNAKIQNNNKL